MKQLMLSSTFTGHAKNVEGVSILTSSAFVPSTTYIAHLSSYSASLN